MGELFVGGLWKDMKDEFVPFDVEYNLPISWTLYGCTHGWNMKIICLLTPTTTTPNNILISLHCIQVLDEIQG